MKPTDPESAAGSHDTRTAAEEPVQVHMVSLGCPKNLVDSEVILGGLGDHGLVVTPDADDADIIVVNTCSFVDSAKEESIDTILEACELKKTSGKSKKVVVTGCLSQRYGPELRKEIPELDAIVGLGEYGDLGSTLLSLTDRDRPVHYQVSDPTKACFAEVGRFRLTPQHYAYIRISEGCDNPCTFCAIPAIRGRFRSKPIPMILDEAREMVASGAKEIVLISQDTTSYGVDLDGAFQLPALLEALNDVDGVEWIRLLYAYPAYTTPEMIAAIADLPKVIPYVDIPLQHISDTMLRRMGRRMNGTSTRALLDSMRERIPGLYLRTTFIVGFPGESDEDFQTLESFVRDFRFERLGVFKYSTEDGTPSENFAGQIDEEVAEERLDRIMLAQQEIAFDLNQKRVGERCQMICDQLDQDEDGKPILIGRTHGEAPEIDSVVVVPLEADPPAETMSRLGFTELPLRRATTHIPQPGDLTNVRIQSVRDYDLVAAIDREPPTR
ncbi:MAG: 30S ribosomal protein S12 methylthiotransferase RimO [Planctomycetota bacterium]